MSKWFFHTFVTYVCWALFFSTALLSADVTFAADTYAVSQTAEVTLAWDPNDPIPEGYRIYHRKEGEAYDYGQPCWTGSDTRGTIYNLDWDTTYYFVVRAFDGTLESADSEEVSFRSPVPEALVYSITTTADTHGTISPNGTLNLVEGTDQTFKITPDTGYHIADVHVDGVSVGPVGSYTITPDIGYRVVQVLIDGKEVGTPTTYVFSDVVANHTIAANFEANTFTINAIAGEGGSISPSGQIPVSQGSSQTFSIATDDGYEIRDIVVNGLSQGALNSYTLQNINANSTIEAQFSAVNQAPTADAGPDQMVEERQEVHLSGLNSVDLDDGIVAFRWYQIHGETVQLSSPDQAETSFTAPSVDTSGISLVFELRVTDFSGETTADTCIVNVTLVNMPPKAEAGQAQTVNEEAMVSLDAGGSTDLDDGIVAYRWQQIQGPDVLLDGDQSAVASFNAPDIGPEGASLVFQLTVTDAGGLQDTDTCIVTVAWINTPPSADAGENQQVNAGDEVTLDGSRSTDVDGVMTLSYRWRQTDGTPVELSDATAEQPSFVAPDAKEENQTLTFELTVADSEGMLDLDTCQVVVAATLTVDEDTTAPDLSVDNPASSIVTTGWYWINMSGRAWDDMGVERVTWVNDLGGSGIASGTDQWRTNYIRLKYGTNVITLTATDAAGNTTTVTRTVVVRFRRWW